jgi:hypothetical protein
MIMEAKKLRMQKYLERKNDRDREKNDESDGDVIRTEREIIQENKRDE